MAGGWRLAVVVNVNVTPNTSVNVRAGVSGNEIHMEVQMQM